MSEADNQADIRIGLGQLEGLRMFRNNRGQFWQGNVVDQTAGMVVLARPRRIEAGLFNGASDLIGWRSRVVTQDMVGKPVALFTSLEVKAKRGTPSEDQLKWIAAIVAAGGLAGVVRTLEDARRVVMP